ncbi:MBOAT family O-acyltransferase [Ekhidna sp.]|uniref:MBOAT family O-acyltransferase n=1 Tax=Ekhidna sp. TaxID=2608089 RepID=UPI003B506D46
MLFNSIEFAIFLPVIFIIYWFFANKNLRIQNTLLLISSYVFYGWWDWRFLGLIIFSSFVDFFVGLRIESTTRAFDKKKWLLLSLLVNLGFLGFFKYYNFFTQSFVDAFTLLGHSFEPSRLNVILPVGISFYTFQTLSYSIDVYRGKMKPTKDIISFFSFVSFFPQLVAGPIERASNLLPQFFKKRTFEHGKAVNGIKQIAWGLFKKMVIGDYCALLADEVFNNSDYYSGSTLVLGAICFTFQIYCDFSGYSDIAIGTSRLFGFDLMTNFRYPYFSRDIAEFWRRWHISLSTWFRDYLYIPLGGSKGSFVQKIRNVFIIFVVSGFWHGANWTFIVWGFLNAMYFIPLMMAKRNRKYLDDISQGRNFPSIREGLSILSTFSLTVFAWIFFRAESLTHATEYIIGIFSHDLFLMPQLDEYSYKKLPVFLIILIVIEWVGRHQSFAIEKIAVNWPKPIRWGFYVGLTVFILAFHSAGQKFIYFQF